MPDPSAPTAPLDPAKAREQLDAQRNRMVAITGNDDEERWELGDSYNIVTGGNLPILAGYKTTHAFFAQEVTKIGERTLRRYGLIARRFAKDLTVRYGTTNLELLASLQRVASIEALPADPGPFPVPIPDGAPDLTKPFAECSAADLRKAIRGLKAPELTLGPDVAARLAEAQAAIDGVVGEESPARIKAHKHGEQLMFDLSDLPADKFEEILEALQGA